MAKSRIDRRGKIRSMIRKRPEGRGPHWSITKRAAVWRRRRIIDDVFLTDTFSVSDSVERNLNRILTDSFTLSDTIVLNGEKVIIDSPTLSDDTFSKDFQKPGLSDSATITDTIGLKLQDNLMLFNNNEINSAEFNAVAYDRRSVEDTLAVSDALSYDMTKELSDSATMSDNIQVSLYSPGEPMNFNTMNLATING